MRKSATVKRVTATPQPGEAAPRTGEIVSADPVPDAGGRARSGVQSLDRAFAILEIMADAGGVIGLSQLAAEAKLPLATIHRLVRTLVDLGYVRQEPSRQYALGESVNLAVLDGDEIVYVAQVQPSSNFMRMFTEVGRRTMPHTTAVGKAILADRTERDVRALLQRTGMPRRTEHTITSPDEFVADLEQTRKQGYAVDDGEQEVGVRCVAVAVPGAPRPMALSMSGPLTRMTDDVVERAAPMLHEAARQIGVELGAPGALDSAGEIGA